MLDRIIKFSLRNRLFILVGAVLLIIAGLYTTYKAEIDVFPDLNAPTVVIMTEANGMAPEEVEQLVTYPIETAMNGATGVRRVRSSSASGFSVVWVEFDWNTDVYTDRQIVSEKLAAVSGTLPAGADTPVLGPQSSILGELLIIGLTSDSISTDELRTIADVTISPQLLSTPGVSQISVIGGGVKEYQILLDPDKMKFHNITLKDVLESTREMSVNKSGGVLYQYGNEYLIRGVHSTDVIERIRQSVVGQSGDHPIRLQDIAEITIGIASPRLGTASEKGQQAVLMTVTKQPNADTVRLTEELDKKIKAISSTLPSAIHISTDIFRQSDFIQSSVDNVKISLIEGGVFVVIILFLFLANIRTTLISLVTIPLSLLVSLLVLHLLGESINTMSLGGLAIAIGSLVDDAIVDVENVWRRLRENQAKNKEDRLPTLRVVYEASREVRMPILNSTLIIVVSFLPLFFLSGMEGKMLIPLGIAFIVALFASTLVALTLTPVLCSYLLRGRKIEKEIEKEGKLTRILKNFYGNTLLKAISHKKGILWGTGILFIITIGIFFTLGHSFLPPFNEGSLTINVSALPGISLEESDRIGQHAEKILLSIPEIKTVARKTGRAELDEHALGVNVSEIEAPFELGDRSHKDFVDDVRERLSVISGANIEIGQPISHRIDAMLSGSQAGIAIKLYGEDLNKMHSIGNQIKKAISKVNGLTDINVEQQIERPEIKIKPDPVMLSRYGISEPDFNEFISVMLAGESVTQIYEGNRSYDLIVRSDEESLNSIERISDLLIDTPAGEKIPLNYVAEIVSSTGPNTINRENVRRKIVISGNASGRDLRGVVNDIQQIVKNEIELPDGYNIEYGGQFESEQEASRTMTLASLLSIVLIYLLLYMQFKNSKESTIILLNLPFALIGGVLVLRLTTGVVSIPAIIGFISLFGIATRNGMLLVTRYNILQKDEGLGVFESVIRGSIDRMNPILMTAMTSALALIPLVFRGELPGNEIQSPMAIVILGGLLSATFLNAYILPIIYLMTHKKSTE